MKHHITDAAANALLLAAEEGRVGKRAVRKMPGTAWHKRPGTPRPRVPVHPPGYNPHMYYSPAQHVARSRLFQAATQSMFPPVTPPASGSSTPKKRKADVIDLTNSPPHPRSKSPSGRR